MHAQRDNSTLIALREVRSLEQERRRRESEREEEARQRAIARAEEAKAALQRAREAEVLAAQRREEARLRDETALRLQQDLLAREGELEQLRRDCEILRQGMAPSKAIVPSRFRAGVVLPWLASGLLGTVALTLAFSNPRVLPAALPQPVAMPCPLPATPSVAPVHVATLGEAGNGKTAPPSTRPTRIRKMPGAVHKPVIPPVPVIGARKPPECDGTDPLCGLP